MSFLRKLLLGVAILLGIPIIAIAVFVMQFDPNDYRAQLRALVQDATNYDMEIRGDLALAGFPLLHASAKDIIVRNGDDALARAEEIVINLSLLPLLRGKIESDGIAIRGLDVTLTKDKKGHGNWEAQAPKAEPADAKGGVLQTAVDENIPPFAGLAIVGVSITDSHFVWRDAQSDRDLTLDLASLSVDEFVSEQPVAVAMAGSIQPLVNDIKSGFHLRAKIHADNSEAFRFEETALTLRPDSETLPHLTVRGAAGFTPTPPSVTLPSLTLRAEDAEIHIAGDWTPKETRASIASNHFDARRLLAAFGQADALAALPKTLLKEVRVRTELRIAEPTVELNNLSLVVAESRLQGWARGVFKKHPTIETSLAINQLDVPALIGKTDKAAGKPSARAKDAEAKKAGDGGGANVIAALVQDRVVATANLNVGTLALENTTLNNVSLALISGKKELDVITAAAQGFGGSFAGNLRINATHKTPQVSALGRIKQMRIQDLLAAANNDSGLSGLLSSNFSLRSRGANFDALLSELNGDVDLSIRDSVLPPSKLSDALFSAVRFLDKKSRALPKTNRTNAAAKIRIKRGVASNNNLRVDHDLFVAKGRGKIDFRRSKIDYALDVGLARKKEAKRRYLPMTIRGRLDDPAIKVDFDALVSEEADKLIKREKKKLKKKLKDKLKEELPGKALDFIKDKLKLPF